MIEYETTRHVKEKVHNTMLGLVPAALLSNHQIILQEQPGHDHDLHSGLGLGA